MADRPRYPVEIPDLPSQEQRDRLAAVLDPLARITSPKLYGAQNIPRSGALLVGNHTIYGLLDVPFLLTELWKRERLSVRGLGEHAHYAIPGWRDLLSMNGMVRGTRENTAELMRRGEHVLVFPGGAREVNKRRGEKYQLIWKNRMGFARLAIEHGYPIVPLDAVGAEDMLDILVDDDNPIYAQFTSAVEKVTGWPVAPIVRGIGLTPLPRPQRLYFSFGEAIDTVSYAGRYEDPRAQRVVRDRVKREIERGLAFLLAEREADPHRGLLPRLLGRAR